MKENREMVGMPSEACRFFSVKVRNRQSLTRQSVTDSALGEVTNLMKSLAGRYQTATQVKGLSHETHDVKEVDSFHLLEDSKNSFAMVRSYSLFRGLRPWYDIEWNLQELGRSKRFPQERIFADNLKKRGSEDDRLEVGLTHSRGVVGVMSYESGSEGYSKGLALVCKGKEKHTQDTEKEEKWKRN